MGNFGVHIGLSKNSWENDDGDDDADYFFGFDKEINRSFSLLVEYDAALNDNQDNYELEDITFVPTCINPFSFFTSSTRFERKSGNLESEVVDNETLVGSIRFASVYLL